MDIQLKRIYEKPSPDDGVRVLIDRLWPRGVPKAEAELDHWEKDAAPSAELRKSWHADTDGHSPEHFAAFSAAYRDELASGVAHTAVERLASIAREEPRLTLLYGAKDTEINHAVILKAAVLEAI